MYKEIDELAEEIRERAEAKGYDKVIFMSDHGLPSQTAHNRNAFYSCNEKLYGENSKEKPKITDFYDKITGFEQ